MSFPLGGHHSEESCRKMSETRRGSTRAPFSEEHRLALSEAAKKRGPHFTGEAHPNWKGAGAGYTALHRRIRKVRGTPSICYICGSFDQPGILYEWANKTGRLDDVNDYQRLCRSCHRKFDAGRRR